MSNIKDICINCGGNLEKIEFSTEEWIFDGKEKIMEIITFKCLQCCKKFVVRREKENEQAEKETF